MRLKTGLSALAAAALLLALGVSPAAADGISRAKGAPAATTTGYCSIRAFGVSNSRTEESQLGTLKVDAFGQSGYTMGVGAGCGKISGKTYYGIDVDYVWDRGDVKLATPATTILTLPHGPELSATARLGFFPDTGPTMIYALAGYTWAQLNDGSMGGLSLSFDGRAGLTYGLGIETRLAENVTAFVEYRHIDWQEDSAAIGPMLVKENAGTNQVRAGIALQFNTR